MAISAFAMRSFSRLASSSLARWRPFLTGVVLGLCLLVAFGAAMA